jgi:glycosyltransferase involved in cell wall biosynthesis
MNERLGRLSVCVVTQQLATVLSGPGLHARNLVTRLQADGHQVHVLAPESERPTGDLTYTFTGVLKPVFSRNQARWMSLAVSFGRALAKLKSNYHFDLIQFTDARESLFCPAGLVSIGHINDTYAADVQPPAYYKEHYGDWRTRWAYYRLVHAAEKRALHRLSAVVANSAYTGQVIQRQYDLAPGKLHVCHKSVELSQYAPALALRAGAEPHASRVLFVGGNMQRKGLPTLIQAAPSIAQAAPDVEFWVAGRDAAQPAMEALCESLGVRERFHFWGLKPQGELLALYAQSDVFAMPSLTEAFGVVFLEAMACGVPVVGTRVGGVPEIVRDSENGLLVPPNDPPALAEALVRLLTDQPLRHRLAAAGLETARAFSVDAMMDCTYGVYRAVLRAALARTAS